MLNTNIPVNDYFWHNMKSTIPFHNRNFFLWRGKDLKQKTTLVGLSTAKEPSKKPTLRLMWKKRETNRDSTGDHPHTYHRDLVKKTKREKECFVLKKQHNYRGWVLFSEEHLPTPPLSEKIGNLSPSPNNILGMLPRSAVAIWRISCAGSLLPVKLAPCKLCCSFLSPSLVL